MKTFEQKLTKLLSKEKRGWNYLEKVKYQRLTDGFWNAVGQDFRDILDDLKYNHKEEYKKFCDENNISFSANTSDWFCS